MATRKSPSRAVTKSDTQHCAICADANPHVRSAHYMKLAGDIDNDVDGLAELKAHVTEQYVTLRNSESQRPDTVADIVEWISTLMKMYRGMVDEHGTSMSWWAARKQMHKYRAYGTKKKGTTETDTEKTQRESGYRSQPFQAPSNLTPDERTAWERKQTHLDHKRTLGVRYRPPCIHGAQDQEWWPNEVCDPDLCATPSPIEEAKPNHKPMSVRDNQKALAHLIETLSVTMDMQQRPRRLSDFYLETNTNPDIYNKDDMSEADYQRRRAIMLAQMAELAHQETVDSAELSNGDQL